MERENHMREGYGTLIGTRRSPGRALALGGRPEAALSRHRLHLGVDLRILRNLRRIPRAHRCRHQCRRLVDYLGHRRGRYHVCHGTAAGKASGRTPSTACPGLLHCRCRRHGAVGLTRLRQLLRSRAFRKRPPDRLWHWRALRALGPGARPPRRRERRGGHTVGVPRHIRRGPCAPPTCPDLPA